MSELCEECGGELLVGSWPFCNGDPKKHEPGPFFGHYAPFPSYVDEHILPDSDPRAQDIGPNGAGETVRGIRIDSRDQRRRLMKEQGLDWHGRVYGRSKNPEF
jgi:hypothetical protein